MDKSLTVLMVGDIFISMPEVYPTQSHIVPMLKPRKDLYSWLEKIAPILQSGDFTLGNLEGPICELKRALSQTGVSSSKLLPDHMVMPPEIAPVLKRVGFSALSTAGSVTMIKGADSMLETLAYLDKAGLAHSGSGKNIVEAHKPAVLERAGLKLAMLSYGSIFEPESFPARENKPGIATVGVNTAYQIPPNISNMPGVLPHVMTIPNAKDVDLMLDDVRRAKDIADIVVVSWHWGVTRYANSCATGIPLEDSPSFVLNYQEEMGRAAIDAGADIIMGHHPHRLQGIEIYKGKLICYSLGNLIMSFGEKDNFGPESAIIKVNIDLKDKKLTRFGLVPLMIPTETMEPHIARLSELNLVIRELERLSNKYGTQFRTDGDEVIIT
jgi:poly-gamma-glutamate capsule biosynthesis protein CapA/YwtB (metallophosphatase superfamily)